MTTTETASPVMTINGTPAATEATFGVINPATGDVFDQAPECTRQQLDAAMQAAATAFRTWRRDETTRRNLLGACSEAINTHADELARMLTQEQGKPLAKAAGEVGGCQMVQLHGQTRDTGGGRARQ